MMSFSAVALSNDNGLMRANDPLLSQYRPTPASRPTAADVRSRSFRCGLCYGRVVTSLPVNALRMDGLHRPFGPVIGGGSGPLSTRAFHKAWRQNSLCCR